MNSMAWLRSYVSALVRFLGAAGFTTTCSFSAPPIFAKAVFSLRSCMFMGWTQSGYYFRWPDHKGDPHIRESHILPPVRPRMQVCSAFCGCLSRPASPRISWYAGFPENPVTQESNSPTKMSRADVCRGEASGEFPTLNTYSKTNTSTSLFGQLTIFSSRYAFGIIAQWLASFQIYEIIVNLKYSQMAIWQITVLVIVIVIVIVMTYKAKENRSLPPQEEQILAIKAGRWYYHY